jgi:hypothetical protein
VVEGADRKAGVGGQRAQHFAMTKLQLFEMVLPIIMIMNMILMIRIILMMMVRMMIMMMMLIICCA